MSGEAWRDDDRPSTAAAVDRTEAIVRRSRWPGWIWSIPLAALGILAWLAVRFFVSHGELATVYFDTAPGVSAQNTNVTYRGVVVGTVRDISLTPDGQHVRVRLSLDRSVEKYLRSGTRFWLQGLSTDLTDIPSLMSAISGPTIEMEPGSGAAQRVFIGLTQPPAFPTPTAGTAFMLLAGSRGSVRVGSKVYYLGLAVGKVTAVQFMPPDRFHIGVFIRSPYDHLVHADSRFWDAGALELSFTNELKLQLLSPAALLEGAIAFETPTLAAGEPVSPAGWQFTLYEDRSRALLAPIGPQVLYTVQLPGAVGGLQPGAPVKLRDFTIGEVRDVGFAYDASTGTVSTPVTLELDALRLHLSGTRSLSGAHARQMITASADTLLASDQRRLLNDAMMRLVREGLRARLVQDPPLVGAYYVSLDIVPNAPPARLDETRTPPVIPAAAGNGLSSLTSELSQLPLRQIMTNVRVITGRLRTLAMAPQTEQALAHVDQTLTNIDQMVQSAKPDVQRLIGDLRRAAAQLQGLAASAHQTLGGPEQQVGLYQTLDELTRTARSVRSLADYLERHPASLLRGKPP